MAQKYNKAFGIPGSIGTDSPEPSDPRYVVELLSDLTAAEDLNDPTKLNYIYEGILVYVLQNKGTYQYLGGDRTDINNWVDQTTKNKEDITAIMGSVGQLSFPTVALAKAYYDAVSTDPKPDNNTLVYIANDQSYYKWLDSEPNRVQFVKSVALDATPTATSTNAVQSSGVFNEYQYNSMMDVSNPATGEFINYNTVTQVLTIPHDTILLSKNGDYNITIDGSIDVDISAVNSPVKILYNTDANTFRGVKDNVVLDPPERVFCFVRKINPDISIKCGYTIDGVDIRKNLALKADKTYVDEKIDGIVTSVPILDASATYANKQDIEDFILDISISEGVPTEVNETDKKVFLRRIQDNGDGTFRMDFGRVGTSIIVWSYEGVKPANGIVEITYTETSLFNDVTITVELDFDNFVLFANTADNTLCPFNMDRMINGVSTDVDPNSVVGKIEIAKQEAITTASSDAASKANTAEQNAKDYADNLVEVDSITIYNREYSTTKEVINGVSEVVETSTVFLPSANYATLTELNTFIKSIKSVDGAGSNFTSTDDFFILDIADEGSNVVRFRLRNSTGTTTTGYFDYTGLSGVQTLTQDNFNYSFSVTIDVDNLAYTGATGTLATLPIDMVKMTTPDTPVNETDPNGIVEILDRVSEDANAYTDLQIGNIDLPEVDEIDPVTIFNRQYTTTKELVNGVVTNVEVRHIIPSNATYSNVDNLRNFILDIRAIDGAASNFSINDEFFILRVRDNGDGRILIQLRDNITSTSVNSYVDIQASGVHTIDVGNVNYNYEITLDFDNIVFVETVETFVTLPLDMEILTGAYTPPADTSDPNGIGEILSKTEQNAKDYADEQLNNFSTNPKLVNIETDSKFESTEANAGYILRATAPMDVSALTVDSNGINFDINNYTGGSIEAYRTTGLKLTANMRYAVTCSYVVNSITNLAQASEDLGFTVRLKSTANSDSVRFGSQVISESIVGETITETKIIDAPETFVDTQNGGQIFVKSLMTNLESSNISMDLTIKSIKIYELGVDNTNPLYNVHPLNINKLVKNTFDDVDILEVLEPIKLDKYYGRYLITWGMSVVATSNWQPHIVAEHGMIFERDITTGDGLNGVLPTAKGGTYLTPIYTGELTKEQGDSSYERITASFTYYDETYTNEFGTPLHLFMFGFNESNPGEQYANSTYTVPADYGLSDTTPYLGSAFDLTPETGDPNITTPLTSFGASYRGVMEYCYTQKPKAEIMLINMYKAPSAPESVINGLNAVINAVGEEYNTRVLDTTKLWNPVNWLSWLKDGIHLGEIGAEKMGKDISRQM
jgi:hypothetical protein